MECAELYSSKTSNSIDSSPRAFFRAPQQGRETNDGAENDIRPDGQPDDAPTRLGRTARWDVMSSIDQTMGQDVAVNAEASTCKQRSDSRSAVAVAAAAPAVSSSFSLKGRSRWRIVAITGRATQGRK